MRMDIAEAAKERQTELVRSMLTNNGELTDKMIESKDREYNGTALYWMSVNGELDIVRRLLERHADVNTCNIYKHTPLHAAADMGFLNILRLLLAHGARTDVLNENGQTPLHLAAYRGYYDVTECLIKAGADQTIQNARCLTPVQESIAMNHTHVAKLFCKDDSSAISLATPTKVLLTKSRSLSPRTLNNSYQVWYNSQIDCQSCKSIRHKSVEPTPPLRIDSKTYKAKSEETLRTPTTQPGALRVCQPSETDDFSFPIPAICKLE